MKRLFTLSVLFAALFTFFATNNTTKAQPESFTQDFLQEDYRDIQDGNGEQLVRTNIVTVVWDADADQMIFYNFYKNTDIVNTSSAVVNLILNGPNSPNYGIGGNDYSVTSITWVSDTKATFTWRMNYLGKTTKSGWTGYPQACVCHLKKNKTRQTPTIYNEVNYYDASARGSDLSGEIDLEEGKISINGSWGLIIGTGSSWTFLGSSRIVEGFDRSEMHIIKTDLVDIVNDGTVGEEYTVNDDLVGVKVVDNMLFAKDLGKYKNPSVLLDGQDDFMGRVVAKDMYEEKVHPAADYDQSNWVMLTGLNNPSQFVGYRINGKSIKGTLVDKVNPTIAVTSNPEQGDQYGYEPNLYIMPSFNEAYYSPNSQFFFVAPKVQEYAYITWACYAADGNFYTMSDGNANNLSGGIKVNWDYFPSGNPQDGYVYEFDAIVRKVASATSGAPLLKDDNQSTPVTGALSADYIVYPLRLTDVPTAINTVEATGKVVNVKYYNLMGVESSTPFDGVNIVVTTYDNGSRSTSKILY